MLPPPPPPPQILTDFKKKNLVLSECFRRAYNPKASMALRLDPTLVMCTACTWYCTPYLKSWLCLCPHCTITHKHTQYWSVTCTWRLHIKSPSCFLQKGQHFFFAIWRHLLQKTLPFPFCLQNISFLCVQSMKIKFKWKSGTLKANNASISLFKSKYMYTLHIGTNAYS